MGVTIDERITEPRIKPLLAATDGPGGSPPALVLSVQSSAEGSEVMIVAGDERVRLVGGDSVILALGPGVDVGVYHVRGGRTTVSGTILPL